MALRAHMPLLLRLLLLAFMVLPAVCLRAGFTGLQPNQADLAQKPRNHWLCGSQRVVCAYSCRCYVAGASPYRATPCFASTAYALGFWLIWACLSAVSTYR
jgi:hypothetical protein